MTTGLSPHKHRGISRSGCLKLESPTLIMTLASSNRRHIRASFSHSSSKYLRAPEETTCSLLFCLMHKKNSSPGGWFYWQGHPSYNYCWFNLYGGSGPEPIIICPGKNKAHTYTYCISLIPYHLSRLDCALVWCVRLLLEGWLMCVPAGGPY